MSDFLVFYVGFLLHLTWEIIAQEINTRNFYILKMLNLHLFYCTFFIS